MSTIDDDSSYKEVVTFEHDHPGLNPFSINYKEVNTKLLSKYAVAATASLALLTGEGFERIIEASALHGRVVKGENPESLKDEVTGLLAKTWMDLCFPPQSAITGCRGLLQKRGDYNNDYYSRHPKECEGEKDDDEECQDGAALTAESRNDERPLHLADDKETQENKGSLLIKNTVPSGTLLQDQQLSVEGTRLKTRTE